MTVLKIKNNKKAKSMKLKQFEEKKVEFIAYLEIEKNLSFHTIKAYRSDLNQLIKFWSRVKGDSENMNLNSILERYFIYMFHEQIDKVSIARKVSCFKSFEKFAKLSGIELELKLTRPKLDKKLPIYLTIDEISYLLEKAKTYNIPTRHPLRDLAVFELLYATGTRCSELVNIKLNEINLSEKTIRVMGKGRKERIVLFGEQAKNRILDYLDKERSPIEKKDEYLFLNNRLQKITPRTIQRIIEMFRQFLKIERKITPHKLRHSFATHLLNQGVDLRMVQELLGHQSLSSTERYTHVTTKELTDMYDSIHPLNKIKPSEQ